MEANNDVLNYGSGRKVANVDSVILPPLKLEFKFENQDWIQREANEVCNRADDLFTEVSKALQENLEKISVNNGGEAQDSCQQIAELERLLEEERMEFQELLGKMLNGEEKDGQTTIDILEVNHLRRQLALQAYSWEQHLVQITSSHKKDSQAAIISPSHSLNIKHQTDQNPGKKNLPDALDAAWTGTKNQSSSKKGFPFLEPLLNQAGVRLPVGIDNKVVPVYEDEPSSIISHALLSPDYHVAIMSDESEKLILESEEESVSFYTNNLLHTCISFSEEGKLKYKVTCYYAKHFEALREACCFPELDFVRSLSRSTKRGFQGSTKTLDGRFIVKEVTKKELESFVMFAPGYFKYLSESIASNSPTCLAKIFGIYQITSKNLKGGKESKLEVLVMENLMRGPRYNPEVLLDQNSIEAMPTSPIYIGSKAKKLLERAIWNDTAFLASVNVMEYSLLVGLDDEKHEMVVGVIDYMRQYTWDKQLETWVKRAFSAILGGAKNASSPTVISPVQYKKRFRKAISDYFIMVTDVHPQCEGVNI